MKTMRNAMVAATLMAMTACGSVQDAPAGDNPNGGSDMGSDMGSGSGSSSEPTTCNSAADCGEGQACDVGSKMCVTGALTMAPDDFIVDTGTWWTNATGPTLHGTFMGPTGAMVQARIGSNATLAALDGNKWSVTLPAGSISTSNVSVEIWMTDPSGGLVKLHQVIGLDTAPPVITLKPSNVRDEAGDAIDFSSGQPVHTHSGANVDLASAGCPVVHKYAYLMGPSDPVFGRQTSINPLAWKFSIQDMRLDQTSLAYRVRDASNAIAVDWTTLPAATNGIYKVELDRRNVAALGNAAGNYHLEVRARDWTGLETIASWCWDHEPLAAPLDVGQLAASSDGLFSMSLPANSPISSILNFNFGASVVEQQLVQYAAEPIDVSFTQAAVNASYSKRVITGYVPYDKAYMSTANVDESAPAPPSVEVTTGPLVSAYFTVRVIDPASGNDLIPNANGSYTIPARSSSEAPHAYKLVVDVSQAAELRPAPGFSFSEYTLGSFTYTGTAPGATTKAVCVGPGTFCSRFACNCLAQLYREVAALDTAHIGFEPITVTIKTAANASSAASIPAYVPTSHFSAGPMTWDAGDDDVGGY